MVDTFVKAEKTSTADETSNPDNKPTQIIKAPAQDVAPTIEMNQGDINQNNLVIESESRLNVEAPKIQLDNQEEVIRTNADLLRQCIEDQSWEMVAELTEEWAPTFKAQVWRCLTTAEQKAIRELKPQLKTESSQIEQNNTIYIDKNELNIEPVRCQEPAKQPEKPAPTLKQQIKENWDNTLTLGNIILAKAETEELQAFVSECTPEQIKHILGAAKYAWKPSCVSFGEYDGDKVELFEFGHMPNWKVRPVQGKTIVRAKRSTVFPWLGEWQCF